MPLGFVKVSIKGEGDDVGASSGVCTPSLRPCGLQIKSAMTVWDARVEVVRIRIMGDLRDWEDGGASLGVDTGTKYGMTG